MAGFTADGVGGGLDWLSRQRVHLVQASQQVLNVKLFDGSFLTLFNAKDASSHHNI